MAVHSTIAWAQGSDHWVAVAPVVGPAAGGGLLVGASIAALTTKAGATEPGGRPMASWSGELVLRDGRRLALGGDHGCQMSAENGLLALHGPLLADVSAGLWRAARVELVFGATA